MSLDNIRSRRASRSPSSPPPSTVEPAASPAWPPIRQGMPTTMTAVVEVRFVEELRGPVKASIMMTSSHNMPVRPLQDSISFTAVQTISGQSIKMSPCMLRRLGRYYESYTTFQWTVLEVVSLYLFNGAEKQITMYKITAFENAAREWSFVQIRRAARVCHGERTKRRKTKTGGAPRTLTADNEDTGHEQNQQLPCAVCLCTVNAPLCHRRGALVYATDAINLQPLDHLSNPPSASNVEYEKTKNTGVGILRHREKVPRVV
ncbi:hypothetical protein B0H11DRAFT_1904243 [Mycena galericulata]|nr:hypothetical protein B0H11DRAFT_1904243 [Mycena galericulata]